MAHTSFIPYLYPGWHASSWRPGLNEWELLDAFEPYFPGHPPPPRPADGRYDDSHPEVVASQVEKAQAAGIAGFTCFMYPGPEGFVLADPLDHALSAAANTDFTVGATWCLRLPHHFLPLSPQDTAVAMGTPVTVSGPGNGHSVRLGDLAELFGELNLAEFSLDEK